jgi:hypothetical protein
MTALPAVIWTAATWWTGQLQLLEKLAVDIDALPKG